MILREERMIKERYSTIIPIARNIYNTGHLMRSDAIQSPVVTKVLNRGNERYSGSCSSISNENITQWNIETILNLWKVKGILFICERFLVPLIAINYEQYPRQK